MDWRTVESAACSLGWKDEKRARDMARERRAKPDAEAQVAIEAEQDERHADQARRVLDARDLLIERAIGDIQGMTAKEARRALRDFDGLKDLQFVERIARGRSTEKTAIEGASESYRAELDRLVSGGLLVRPDGRATTTDPGTVPPVVRGPGVDTAPGAAPGPGTT